MINFDNDFSQMILNNTSIFKHVHPNYVTAFGIILNFILSYYLFIDKKNHNLYLFASILFFRWLADCLDGNIARKYKKTSKIGNILDSLSDIMLSTIMYFYVCMNIENITIVVSITILCVLYAYYSIFENKIFESHEKLKQTGGIINNTQSFLINNTFILFIIFFMLIKNIN